MLAFCLGEVATTQFFSHGGEVVGLLHNKV